MRTLSCVSNEELTLCIPDIIDIVFSEPNKDEIKVVKMIEDMVPDDVMRLGQELGLGIVRMKGMSLSSIHSDMAYAWLMRFDNVPQTSGRPTWRALARALSEMKCQNVVDKIIQSELLLCDQY